jgi:hypothetical protein
MGLQWKAQNKQNAMFIIFKITDDADGTGV